MISVDGGPEQEVDFYSAGDPETLNKDIDRLVFDTGVLAEGDHVLKVRVTNTPSSQGGDSNGCVSFKRAEIYTGGSVTEPPEQKADVSALYSLMLVAGQQKQESFSPSTWAAFEPLRAQAQELLANVPAADKQAEVDALYASLADALYGLKRMQEITGIKPEAQLRVALGTAADQIAFPAQVTVTLADGTSQSVDAGGWTCETFDGSAPGDYVFTGTLALPDWMLNTAALAPTVIVTVEADATPEELALKNALAEAQSALAGYEQTQHSGAPGRTGRGPRLCPFMAKEGTAEGLDVFEGAAAKTGGGPWSASGDEETEGEGTGAGPCAKLTPRDGERMASVRKSAIRRFVMFDSPVPAAGPQENTSSSQSAPL